MLSAPKSEVHCSISSGSCLILSTRECTLPTTTENLGVVWPTVAFLLTIKLNGSLNIRNFSIINVTQYNEAAAAL